MISAINRGRKSGKVSLGMLAMALLFSYCGSAQNRLQQPDTSSWTLYRIQEASAQWMTPADWNATTKDAAIELDPPERYPAMRFAAVDGGLRLSHKAALEKEMNDMISFWTPVEKLKVNGMDTWFWTGRGGNAGLRYELHVWLIDRGNASLVVLAFIPEEQVPTAGPVAWSVVSTIEGY